VSLFFSGVSAALLSAGELPRCSANAPCFTIVNRLSSAALAVKSTNISNVYRNGLVLTKGPAADYELATGANSKAMVIVHMPANTTGQPEVFQVIVK
jgi:hypothetical protein